MAIAHRAFEPRTSAEGRRPRSIRAAILSTPSKAPLATISRRTRGSSSLHLFPGHERDENTMRCHLTPRQATRQGIRAHGTDLATGESPLLVAPHRPNPRRMAPGGTPPTRSIVLTAEPVEARTR